MYLILESAPANVVVTYLAVKIVSSEKLKKCGNPLDPEIEQGILSEIENQYAC